MPQPLPAPLAWAAARPYAAALLLAAVLAAPCLALPFVLDDWFQLSALDAWRGLDTPRLPRYFEHWREPWGGPSCFAFFRGPAENEPLIRAGLLPWWLNPALEVRFFRPLASLTHLADGVLFGPRPALHHAHSLLWYAASILAVGALYRRALPGSGAVVALLLFAIDESHWFPAAWISNRNALIAAALGAAGLLAHLRWREDGWRPGLPLSLLALAASLCAGETALGVFGLLASYQLLAAPGGPRGRFLGLLPALALGLAWVILYKALGYGAQGSGLYIDPTRDPGAYLAAAASRAPVLLGGQIANLPADLYFFSPAAAGALTLGGALSCLALAAGLRWLWPALDPAERRALRWLIPGGLLALAPVLATFPLSRLLLVPGIGLIPPIALLARQLWRVGRRGWLAALLLLHAASAPAGWWGMTAFALHIDRQIAAAQARAPAGAGRDRAALIVNLSDPALAIYLPITAAYQGQPLSAGWHPLSLEARDHRLTRLAERELRIEVLGGAMGESLYARLFRAFEQAPFAPGDRVETDAFTLEILAADGGLPSAWVLRLARDLSAYDLLTWRDGALQVVPAPAIGEAVVLPHEPGPMGL